MFPNQEIKVIECRLCLSANRIRLEQAFRQPGGVRCGRCHKVLLLGREGPHRPKNPSQPGADYQHPLDRETLSSVHAIPGVDSLLQRLQSTYEPHARLFSQSSFLHATGGQLSTLRSLLERAAQRLDLKTIPELYLRNHPTPDTKTVGVEQASLILTSGLVDLFDDEELFAWLSHTLSHWQSGHVRYKMAIELLTETAVAIAGPTLELGNLPLLPLRLALLRWERCASLSADRAMLLATRDPELSLRVLLKLAGGVTRFQQELSLERFLVQAQQSRQSPQENVLGRIYTLSQLSFSNEPFPLWRAAELWRWACDGEYLSLLQDSAF